MWSRRRPQTCPAVARRAKGGRRSRYRITRAAEGAEDLGSPRAEQAPDSLVRQWPRRCGDPVELVWSAIALRHSVGSKGQACSKTAANRNHGVCPTSAVCHVCSCDGAARVRNDTIPRSRRQSAPISPALRSARERCCTVYWLTWPGKPVVLFTVSTPGRSIC
jgi:hypothetical protein